MDDFGKLEAWRRLFASGQVLVSATSAALAEQLVTMVKQGFRTETDPYGKKWAPKQKPDGRKVLSGETSRLKGGWHIQKTKKAGFTVAPSVDYAAPHQAPRRGPSGRLKRPRRMMVPSAERGMPRPWSKELREVAAEVARAYYSTERVQPKKVKTAGTKQKIKKVVERAQLSLGVPGQLRRDKKKTTGKKK